MTLAQVRVPTSSRVHRAAISATRILDLIVGCAGLAVSAPIMLLVAVAIWFDSGRPIFFSQIRLGRAGRYFRIYKFRKFYRDVGTRGYGITLRGDRRMTRVGRVLARTKLDELPQFWNVLKGDMSAVGPRPESLKFADCFTPHYLGLLCYKPGIFGPSQWYCRDEASLYPKGCDPEQFYRETLFPLKARIDLEYFPSRTLTSDVGWIIRCVLAVFGVYKLPADFNGVYRRSNRPGLQQGYGDQGETGQAQLKSGA